MRRSNPSSKSSSPRRKWLTKWSRSQTWIKVSAWRVSRNLIAINSLLFKETPSTSIINSRCTNSHLLHIIDHLCNRCRMKFHRTCNKSLSTISRLDRNNICNHLRHNSSTQCIKLDLQVWLDIHLASGHQHHPYLKCTSLYRRHNSRWICRLASLTLLRCIKCTQDSSRCSRLSFQGSSSSTHQDCRHIWTKIVFRDHHLHQALVDVYMFSITV